MIAFLRRNFAYKLLSLAIAILLYAIAYAQNHPTTSRDIYIQPVMEGLSDNVVIKTPPTGTSVTVSGPSALIDPIRAQAIHALVDASQAQPGGNHLPITYNFPPGIHLDGPAYSDVVLDKKISASFTVDVVYNNNPPAGYRYAEPVATPKNVQVLGSLSQVSRVARVIGSLDQHSGAGNGTVDGIVDLVAQDQAKHVVDNVEIKPARVKAHLELKRSPATKTLVLSPIFSGQPAPGYTLYNYAFTPGNITVTGPQEQLENRSTIDVPVDIAGISESTTRSITVSLPPNFATVNAADAHVRLRLETRQFQPISGPPPITPSPSPAPAGSGMPAPPSAAIERNTRSR